jgi:hypothetical protein
MQKETKTQVLGQNSLAGIKNNHISGAKSLTKAAAQMATTMKTL